VDANKENAMCDLKAYVKQNNREDLILESVNLVRAEGGEVILKNLFGEEKRVRGSVQEVSLVKSRVVIQAD
jgi:predicted RNA-binding protein